MMSTAARWAIALTFACLCLAYLQWVWIDQITEYGGDSAAYMLWARYLSPFVASSTALREAVHATPFPPLFPLLVGLLGAGFLTGHLIVALSLLASIALLFLWLRDEGLPVSVSAATALTFALMPGTYLQSLDIMSENLYLALSLTCIVLERRAEQKSDAPPSSWWWLAAALSLTPLVRTAAVALLAAFALRLWMIRQRHRYWLVVASCLPFLAWLTWSALSRAGIWVYAEQGAPLYSGHLVSRLSSQLHTEFRVLAASWVDDWLNGGRSGTLVFASGALGLICLLGFLRRLLNGAFDAIYVALYLVMLSLWPFPDAAQRLSYVIVPLLLAQGAMLLASLAHKLQRRHAMLMGAAFAATLSLLLLPSLYWTAARFLQPLPAERMVERHTRYWYRLADTYSGPPAARFFSAILNDLPRAQNLIPPGDCVFSQKATVVTLLTGRMSYPPPAFHSSEQVFEREISRCRYAYVLAIISPSFPEPLYPLARLGGQVQILSRVASGGAYPIPYAELLKLDAVPREGEQ